MNGPVVLEAMAGSCAVMAALNLVFAGKGPFSWTGAKLQAGCAFVLFIAGVALAVA